MRLNFLDWLTKDEQLEATGTFADGVFHLTRDEKLVEMRRERLRTSYDRDFRTARRMADTAALQH